MWGAGPRMEDTAMPTAQFDWNFIHGTVEHESARRNKFQDWVDGETEDFGLTSLTSDFS